MGWWSEEVMGGDSPMDWEGDISDMVGGHFDSDEGHVYTREQIEAKLSDVVAHIEAAKYDREIGFQVLGVLALKKGAHLPDDVKERIIRAAEEDEWAKEGDRMRKAHMKDLITKVRAHEPGEVVEVPSKELLDQMEKNMVREQFGPVRVGVAAVLRRNGKVLMGLRKGSHGAGTWSFPGGHQEFGEGPAVTASRELFEETGLRVDPEKFRRLTWTNDFFEQEMQHYITLYFEADYEGEEEAHVIEPNRCGGWDWFDEPPKDLFLPIQHLVEQEPEAFHGRIH